MLASLALLAPGVQAERADRFQPIQVESDRMQYDDIKQVNVFVGQVVLTRGTLVLRADQLVLRQDPEGYAHGTATGQLARFRQKRDGLDEWVEGQGEEIIYDGKAETPVPYTPLTLSTNLRGQTTTRARPSVSKTSIRKNDAQEEHK